MDYEEEKLIEMIEERKLRFIKLYLAIACIFLWIGSGAVASIINSNAGIAVFAFGWAASIVIWLTAMDFIENAIEIKKQKEIVNAEKLYEANRFINQHNKY